MSGVANIPEPRIEPVLSYATGTPERAALKAAIGSVGAERTDIPIVVGGKAGRRAAAPGDGEPLFVGGTVPRAS